MFSRTIMLLAGALPALSGAAFAADIPGNAKTKATLPVSGTYTQGVFDFPRDSDWYKVTLEKGRDYAVSTYADCGVTFGIRNSAGKLLAGAKSDDLVETGFEFRPSYSGTYFVEYRQVPDPYCGGIPSYPARIAPDCRADRTTTCKLKVGVTQQRVTAWAYDEDWFKVDLVRGRTYAVEVDDPGDVSTYIVDARGFVLATGSQPFKPSSGGTYYVRLYSGNDDGQAYRVTLTAR
jgi:hypothetical protein